MNASDRPSLPNTLGPKQYTKCADCAHLNLAITPRMGLRAAECDCQHAMLGLIEMVECVAVRADGLPLHCYHVQSDLQLCRIPR